NIVIKMNTGGGKTIVGLILLKSCLNEKKGPAVYVVPDNYLVKQVIDEGNKLGIGVTNDEESMGFLTGKDILVINIYKLINGRSKFGVGDEGKKISIGSIIID
ncbi:DEAD/DEAH box helicase, partial [Klebsiella pneumoniae]